MKTLLRVILGLVFCPALVCPAALDGQGLSPAAGVARGSPRGCEAPRTAFRRLLAHADSIFGGVGSQAAILRDGQLAVAVENGWSDLEHRVPVTTDTRFRVASVTKAFTGMALLKLREDGRIELDRPVQDYVPSFPRKPGVITPRLLAAHVGGIRHYEAQERTSDFLFAHYDRVSDALALFSDDPLVVAPGTRSIYSSYGYNLLAAAIGRASGAEFDEYVRRVIIEPLGLTRTRFDDARRPVDGRASGYTYYYPWHSQSADSLLFRVPAFDYSYNDGGGNMLSTARDLVYLGRAVIRPGLLNPESIAFLSTPIRPELSRWSFGWMVEDSTDGPRLRSEGSVPGFQATIEAYPAEDLVVALLLNSWGKWPADRATAPNVLRQLVTLCLDGETTP